MSQQGKQEAAEKLGRAARQARHAASNVGDAAEAGAEVVKDEIVEKSGEAQNVIVSLAKKAVFTEQGRAYLALGIGVASAVVGVKKFQDAMRMSEAARTIITPSEADA